MQSAHPGNSVLSLRIKRAESRRGPEWLMQILVGFGRVEHKKCFFPGLMLSPAANPGAGLKVGWGSLATLYPSPSYSLFKA